MKKKLRFGLLLMLAVLAFSVSALADSGPKPQLAVTVTNAPKEVYYLDLVEAGDYVDSGNYPNLNDEERAALDPVLLQKLLDNVPEGWHACLTQGTSVPMWGDLCARSADRQGNPLHHFSYVGLPGTYRILIVTKSGESWVSEPMTRHAQQSSVIVDWAAKTAAAPPVWRAYVLEFLATCIPTLLLEGIVLLAFGYHLKKSWKPFLFTNLATQAGLYLGFGIATIVQGFSFWDIFLFTLEELVILLVEVGLYRRYLTEQSKRRATAYAVAANFCSAVLGWFLAAPIWNWISSLT